MHVFTQCKTPTYILNLILQIALIIANTHKSRKAKITEIIYSCLCDVQPLPRVDNKSLSLLAANSLLFPAIFPIFI